MELKHYQRRVIDEVEKFLQAMAKGILQETESPTLTDLPPLDYAQTRRIEHRLVFRRH